MPTDPSLPRGRRAAYSVAEVANLCRLSRARFYDLIRGDRPVMPPPVYDLVTRRPFYPAELAARCVEVRDSNIGIDGRFVVFYESRSGRPTTRASPTPAPPTSRRRQAPLDPLTQEMVDSLRLTGVRVSDAEIIEAIGRCCPSGLVEARFNLDFGLIRSELQRQQGV